MTTIMPGSCSAATSFPRFSPWRAVTGTSVRCPRGVKTGVDGFDAFAVAGFPLGPIRLFGKLGGIYAQSSTRIRSGVRFSSSGFDIAAKVTISQAVQPLMA